MRKIVDEISARVGGMVKSRSLPREERLTVEVEGVRLAATAISGHMAEIVTLLKEVLGQFQKINQNLSGIHEELMKRNILASSGGSGELGFARTVYSFISMHIMKATGTNDLFFLWHPDTSWHPVFYDMIAEKPLPESYCGESDNLDKLCILMKTIRQIMGPTGKKPVFHLLIPAWYGIPWSEAARFPDEILPLHVVGPTHHMGRPLVSFNLPCVQHNLQLENISNCFDEQEEGEGSSLLVLGGVAGVAVSLATGPAGGFAGLPASVAAICAGMGAGSGTPKMARILGSKGLFCAVN